MAVADALTAWSWRLVGYACRAGTLCTDEAASGPHQMNGMSQGIHHWLRIRDVKLEAGAHDTNTLRLETALREPRDEL